FARLNPGAASVAERHLGDDSEPRSGSLDLASDRALEQLEDALAMLRLDAGTAITHDDAAHMTAVVEAGDLDFRGAPGTGELECVGDEVVDRLRRPGPIDLEDRQVAGDLYRRV